MTAPQTPSAILLAAADLIERTGWTQERAAANDKGETVRHIDFDACQFCVTAAIRRVSSVFGNFNRFNAAAMKRLERHLGTLDLPTWNDTPGRTKEDIVAALREAAR